MKKNSTVRDVARSVVGDATVAYVETVGGVKVGMEEGVGVGVRDVSFLLFPTASSFLFCHADVW